MTAPDGSIQHAIGAVDAPMYPRSCAKPMQAVGMLRSGLDLDGRLLALAAASHSGEEIHREGVVEILSGTGLTLDALQTPPDWPIDETARVEWIAAGHQRESITMNCSGKHAAMLRTCVRAGWSTDDYRDPDHPLQRAIRDAIADLAGEEAAAPTTDGCGAPLFAVSLAGLARSFGRIAAAGEGTDERRVADAYRAHPEYASGTRRDEVALHRAVDGLVCKAGAEACFGVGLPDGRGIAVKIDDGTPRGSAIIVAETLRALGFDHPELTRLSTVPVLGHGRPVGEIRLRAGSLDALAAH
ncbi:asparaginase [Mariniluteicoccus flavus]